MMMLESVESLEKPVKVPKEYRIRKGMIFCDADRFRNVVRIDKKFFQVNSQRSENIFHYVKMETAKNPDGTVVDYWTCSNCPGYDHYDHCWHISEVSKVYQRDPLFLKEVKG